MSEQDSHADGRAEPRSRYVGDDQAQPEDATYEGGEQEAKEPAERVERDDG